MSDTPEQSRAYAEGFRDARAAASTIVAGYTDGDSRFDSTIARIADDIDRLRGLEPIKPGMERMTGLCTDKVPCAIATDLRRALSETVNERDDFGRRLNKERRDAAALADAVGRYIDGGCNDEEGLHAALSKWAQYVGAK